MRRREIDVFDWRRRAEQRAQRITDPNATVSETSGSSRRKRKAIERREWKPKAKP